MKTKLLSTILAASTMLAGLVMPVSAEGFTDISGSPYAEAVNSLVEQGIVSGRGDGRYSPDEGLSRAEMVSIILRAYGSTEIEDIEKFNDVPPTHWAYMQIETAYQMGIVAGTTDVTFEPEAQVTFEQAVKMLVSAMKKDSQAKKLGGWPDGYIAVAEEAEVLGGVNSSKGQVISRGSMAQLVYNCLNNNSPDDYMFDWTGVADHYDWIRDEKIRCTYGHSPMTYEDENGVLKRLENAGINCVFLNINDGVSSGTMEGWKKDVAASIKNLDEKYNLHDFIKINFGDNGVTPNNAYGNFHPGIFKESYFNSPCPLSKEYWDHQILERTLYLAEFPSVEGIILDFEMYSGGISQYTSPCMCDQCWPKYLEAKGYKGEWKSVETINRSEYINKQGKVDEYKEWFEDEIVDMLKYIREETHNVNPKIIFGYFPGFEWLPGMTEGLGTPEKPVIIASEVEYWGSLASTKETMIAVKENKDMHALYCPGFFPDAGQALTAAQLEAIIKQAAPTTAGYWMYSAHLLQKYEDNYQAVENANKNLDEQLASGQFSELPVYEIREYTAKKIAGEVPTEAEWERAAFTEDFEMYKGEERTPPVESRAKILYSDNDFFVRVYAYDNMDDVVIGEKQARDGNPWAGDCVEFFWRFDGATDMAQLVSDLAGSYWDAYCTGIASKNSSVNFEGFSAETNLFDDHWEMTMRVPGTLDGVNKIEKGDVLRIEIGRYHFPSRGKVNVFNHCWAPTYGSYLGSPSLWGRVVLG
ncbi:MAG: S-layer homology domain-containing protein [Clostridia bacterium]|nr:S-layer homology domain-containing protein [Clostridia bacterium]